MNSLSWLIYLASLVDSLNSFFVMIAVFGIMMGGAACFFYVVVQEGFPPRKLLTVPMIGFLFAFIACFIPNEKTIMYIAASEYGETIMKSKEVQDLKNPAMELLQTWIKTETARLKTEAKK
mgnify:CR=1 FL=1